MSEPTPTLERTIEALLFLSPEPISAAELVEACDASEAAVGTAGETADDAERVVLDLASSREDYGTVRGIAAQHSSDPQARDRTTNRDRTTK